MGQYYYPTILREKGHRFYSQQFYSHDYDRNGLKLMEHSYVGNSFTETVLAQLFNNPGRLAWIGDYHEEGDIARLHDNDSAYVKLDELFRRHYKKFHYEKNWHTGEVKTNYSHPEMVNERKGRFILNHDKKQFIDMVWYEEHAPRDAWGCMIHPLPLLTAVGNGRGGGDYWGIYEDDIGSWAGDLIETQNAQPNGYCDITEGVMFEEVR